MERRGLRLLSDSPIQYGVGRKIGSDNPVHREPLGDQFPGGSGGSIRIDGYDVTVAKALVDGAAGIYGEIGAPGRIAVYYGRTFNGGFTPGYQQNTSTGQGSTPTPTPTPIIQIPQPPEAGWVAKAYAYASAHPHAAATAGGDSYVYDANGNMTCRVEAGGTFLQAYNAENRLASVKKIASGTCESPTTLATQWQFTYDGDGMRVKQLVTPYQEGQALTPVLTVYFMGGLYEETDGVATKYYAIAGMTVAMKDAPGLKFLLTDYLGSVDAVTDASGTLLSQQRYMPFGEVRTDQFAPGAVTQTDFGYTGQRDVESLGLMDYKARFYDPALGRFTQADTITPNVSDAQSLNRYAYVVNNPIRLSDPSGQRAACGVMGEACDEGKRESKVMQSPRARKDDQGQGLDSAGFHVDAILWGVNVSGSEPGIYNTAGLEEIVMLSSLRRATFSYGGQGSAVGVGASAAMYGGLIFNLKNPEAYKGPFAAAGGTVSILGTGLTVSYFWDDTRAPLSPGTTQGIAVGYAPGAQASAWWSSTAYSMTWQSHP